MQKIILKRKKEAVGSLLSHFCFNKISFLPLFFCPFPHIMFFTGLKAPKLKLQTTPAISELFHLRVNVTAVLSQ